MWTFFLLATTDERSLARTAPSGGVVLGRLAAGVVVIWAEEATVTDATLTPNQDYY